VGGHERALVATNRGDLTVVEPLGRRVSRDPGDVLERSFLGLAVDAEHDCGLVRGVVI
jgi:hypothetical protein